MELSAKHIDQVEKQTDLTAVADDHSIFDRLQDAFGAHTFFMNDEGLFVFRRADDSDQTAQLVAFATWAKGGRNKLVALEQPLQTGVILDLESAELDTLNEPAPTLH